MRRVIVFLPLIVLAACERISGGAPDALEPVEPATPVDVIASDELPLGGPATGLDFWIHPNVAFNSLMIVASAEGLASYNIEDGEGVGRIDDIAAQGAVVSYFGFGPLAAGVIAAFDANSNGFRFYGVDNASRAFLPLAGGPLMASEMRGFCFGRALTAPAPSLFVIEPSGVRTFNLALGDDASAPGFAVEGQAFVETPENIRACAVETDGVLLLANDRGDIYRLEGEDAFAAPLRANGASDVAGLALLAAAEGGAIALLDGSDGVVQLFNRKTGERLGAMRHTTRDAAFADASDADENGKANAPAPPPATVLGGSGANLGALYRNGVIALGLAKGGEPLVRMIPVIGVQNALSLTPGTPVNPRGAPARQEDDALIIPGPLESE